LSVFDDVEQGVVGHEDIWISGVSQFLQPVFEADVIVQSRLI
jgi:hypothetical protein